MFASDQFKEKDKAEVEVQLDDGKVLKGSFFLSPHQRILDALNDERAFLPFEDSEGTMVVIRKARISHIIPVKQKPERTKPIPIPLSNL